jgi:DNA-binding Lrp family transcriptional regulator
MLKSQDILVCLKLCSFQLQDERQKQGHTPAPAALMSAWAGWEADPIETARYELGLDSASESQLDWTYATLSKQIGLSASECNEAVKRALACGLLRKPRNSTKPIPVGKALSEFLVHGLKYVFPGQEGTLARGIPTGFAAPVLASKLLSAGEHIYVWPDARGAATGLTLQPIHKAVQIAVRYDAVLYELMALVDAIRFGKLREAKMASEKLTGDLHSL